MDKLLQMQFDINTMLTVSVPSGGWPGLNKKANGKEIRTFHNLFLQKLLLHKHNLQFLKWLHFLLLFQLLQMQVYAFGSHAPWENRLESSAPYFASLPATAQAA